jgi:hypothetical protein
MQLVKLRVMEMHSILRVMTVHWPCFGMVVGLGLEFTKFSHSITILKEAIFCLK